MHHFHATFSSVYINLSVYVKCYCQMLHCHTSYSQTGSNNRLHAVVFLFIVWYILLVIFFVNRII